MVLSDDALPSDFADDPPPSDDPDTPRRTYQPYLQIDMSSLPHSLPILGPLFGFTQSSTSTRIRQRIEIVSRVLDRPVTHDEASAMAFYTAKALATTSYGPPIGALGGLARAYASMPSFRFPFYTPDLSAPEKPGSFDPNRLLFLRGRSAQLGWHCLRGAAYGFLGGYAGRYVALAYAASVAVVSESRDPRLQEVSKGMQEFVRKRAAGGPMAPPGEAGAQGGRAGQQSRQAPRRKTVYGDDEDDASPTAGFGDPDESSSSLTMQDQEASQPAQARQSPDSYPRPQTDPRRDRFRQDTASEGANAAPKSRGFDDDLYGEGDSAGSSADGSPDGASASSASAWDRIRKGAVVSRSASPSPSAGPYSSSGRPSPERGAGIWGQQRQRQQQQQQQESGGAAAAERDNGPTSDAYTYSTGEEEEQLARGEAQRDFDERVERERRGGNFGRGG